MKSISFDFIVKPLLYDSTFLFLVFFVTEIKSSKHKLEVFIRQNIIDQIIQHVMIGLNLILITACLIQ